MVFSGRHRRGRPLFPAPTATSFSLRHLLQKAWALARPGPECPLSWRIAMRLLAVHPSALMYTRVYLRLEPLGLELVAAAARAAGHDVRLIDLQVETHDDY